jgi:glycine/D-amino acid oxidase-like deaminating enzyme
MTSPKPYDAIILGAGAAGMMCALTAGQRGRRVLLLDHADEPGKKILISGGGRCNFTNIHTAPDRYLSANPHFAKSALGRYTAADFIALVERHGIAWHEKTLGQLFCDGSAKQIVAMLLDECDAGNVTIALGHPARDVDHADGHYRVTYGDRTASAPALVIATGGPSIPKMGATGFAYDLARRPVPLALRRGGGSGRAVRQDRVSRGRPVHPQRTVGPGDPADIFLLAARRINRDRFSARSETRLAARGQARQPTCRLPQAAGCAVARAPRRNPR